jgi:hypothetical protein
MAFNLADFSSNIGRHGILQTNKFEVDFQDRIRSEDPYESVFTQIISNANLSDNEASSFVNGGLILKQRVESFKLPGAVIDTHGTRRYGIGPVIMTGTNVSMDPFSISVITDRDYNIYKFFNIWLDTVFNFSGLTTENSPSNRNPTFLTTYKDDYAVDTEVKIFDNAGTVRVKYKFFDSFPISVSEPQLSWRDNNTIHRFDISFAYTNWQIDNRSSNPP